MDGSDRVYVDSRPVPAGGAILAGPLGRLRQRWEPVSTVVRAIAAVAAAVAGVTGLLSTLVAAGVIHGAQPPPVSAASQPVQGASVAYSTEGLRLRLGQCFGLDSGVARCGEEDLALPERQVGLLALQNGAEVSVLGVRSLADYHALDAAQLSRLSYSDVRTVALQGGLLLAVRTHTGNYAKVWVAIVQTPDYTLRMTDYRMG
jgi:hypothetical protein